MDSGDMSCLNPRPLKLSGPELLHHLIRKPCDSLALEYLAHNQRTCFTYEELHGAADALASRLSKARGNADGAFVVPVLIPQSPQLYIALLAILKAGGAFCPLNVDAPPERVSFILQDVGATVVVAATELAHLIPTPTAAQVVLVDENISSLELEVVKNRLPNPEDLAYVMYTSGSTGTPKGVGISHSSATQALLAHDRHIPPFSRFLQFAAATFDVSVFEIFFPLFRGRTLISVNRREMLDDLPGVITKMEVDACELTPTVASSLLRSRTHAPTLKLLLTIGEMLNASVVKEFGGDDGRDSILWAMYGPTEATIHCTLQESFLSSSSTGNIGIPLETVSCFVIEPAASPETSTNFKILSLGEVGELAVGGYQLADGYINRPEQTAAAFISSPYGRVYRTGDKARLNKDGTLECLGRLSEGQVKLRGQRLELGEVQSAVLRTPGCHGAVAAVVDSILVVFCAVDGGATEDAIISHCKNWLPQYMVPGELVLMNDFPMLPSGKVDTRTLKTEFQARKAAEIEDDSNDSEVSEVEQKFLNLISDTLKVEVSGQMRLHSIGVDSLVSIKLASVLRAEGLAVSATELLSRQTISQLFTTLCQRSSGPDPISEIASLSLLDDVEAISQQHPFLKDVAPLIEDVLPCSQLQVAMLAESAQDPQAYWNEVELAVAEGLATDDILEAVHKLATSYEILRSGFVAWNGAFVSLILNKLQDDQLEIVDEFHELDVTGLADLRRPFRIQIQASESIEKVKLLIHLHHAIYDGWSIDIILSDLSLLLRGASLPPRQQFRSVLTYYRKILNHEFDNSRSFWTEHLLGWNKPPFPKLSGRPAELKQVESQKEKLVMSLNDAENIIKKTGCSLQVVFQAAVALVWGGMLGISDVVLGSVTSGRTVPVDGIEGIVGPCIASLPLRINVDNATDIIDVLMTIKSNNHTIMDHSLLQLSEIKKLVGIQAAESLYDVLFVYQESLFSKDRDTLAVKEIRHLDRLETKLLIEVEPCDDGFAFQATYHSEVLPSDVVVQLLQQVKEVSGYILRHMDSSIQSIRQSIQGNASANNAVFKELEVTSDLAELFEAAALRTPQADAIRFSTSLSKTPMIASTMSYQALNKLSNQIAYFILSNGGKPGEVIAIVMEKSPLLYASILGIVKARCAYLPLLPSIPLERLKEIFRSGNIERCLVDAASLAKVGDPDGTEFLRVDTTMLGAFSEENLDISTDLSRLAYVIYTSGTTGVPKGVAVSQRNIVANVTYLASLYPAAQSNAPRFLQACSQAFDVSVFEIFFTWHAGMCLCAAPNDDLFEDLEHAIRQFQITHLSLTPTVASLIDPKHVPSVEFLVTAGEPMTAAVLDKWGELLWQGYGPSETTNICSVKKMKHGEYIEHLGWVFPNTSVFVMSPGSLTPLPIGWVGEFCFGGEQVADGYLNMLELTAEKFIQHTEYGRIYRSGDMGRMLPDGSLVILGRLDDQVKLRGQRIETSEVSSIITGTALADATVTALVQQKRGATDQLVSFYVRSIHRSEEFSTLDPDEEVHRLLIATLLSRLPSYMMPLFLIPITRVPLTSSGKVDKRRLQTCFEGLSQDYLKSVSNNITEQDNLEWSQTETAVAEIIAGTLNIARSDIDRWTPFATLSLDSISAIGVARELSSHFGSRIAISSILQNSSVAQLGRFIEELPTEDTQVEHKGFSQPILQEVRTSLEQNIAGVSEVLPCMPLQEAMLSYGRGSYFNKVLLRIRIPAEEMRAHWNTVTERHSILRTCFVTTSDSNFPIVQVVLDKWTIPWRTYTVTELSLDGALQEHLKTLPEPLHANVPPVSLALIRYKGSAFLSFICHHALYDGVAIENLWREVEALANGRELQSAVPYAPFLQEALSLPDDTERFWMEHFRGYSPVELFSQPSRRRIDQCLHTVSLDIPYKDIQNRHRSFGTSFLSVCQAAWANVLAVIVNSPDICFGCVMSGRTLALDGIDRLVAPCFNTVPIRTDVSSVSQNIELAKLFHHVNADLLGYQFSPLRLVQKVTGSQGGKLFDTLLLLQKPLQDMDEKIWTLEEDSGEMDIPLVCEVVPCPGLNSVVVNMHYDMSVVGEEVASTLTDIFTQFLLLILNHPYAAPADRSSLAPSVLALLEKLSPRQLKSKIIARSQSGEEEWSETETIVRKVLSELSHVPAQRIRRDTSIFQLGLDSINAVQVASMLRRQGHGISASDVVECQSCAKLAERISTSQVADSSNLGYDLGRFSLAVSSQIDDKLPQDTEVEAILPCTPLQSAMISSFIQSQGQSYLNMVSYAVDEAVSMESIVDAWKHLVHEHPMLRTGFVPIQHEDSAFAMVRHSAASAPLLSINFAQSSNQTVNSIEWKGKNGAAILDNLHLPPWRVMVSQEREGMLMKLLIHHALYDAHSLDDILSQLSILVHGQAGGKSLKVEPGLSQIMAQNLEKQDEAQNFWKDKSELTVVNTFPTMTPLRELERKILSHETMSSLALSSLQSAGRKGGFTVQAIIQAAWTRVLSSYLGEESVVFGVVWSGRTTEETRNAPFPCINTIPVIARNSTSNAELIRSMVEYNVSVHKHQHTPLSQIQKWLGHPATPIFDTLLVYQEQSQNQKTLWPWRVVDDDAAVDYPLSLEVEPIDDDEMAIRVTFFSDVLPMEQATLLVQQFDAIMSHLAQHPEGIEDDIYQHKPELFAIMPPVSQELPAPVVFLHQFVEDGARLHPDKIALEFVNAFNGETAVKQCWTFAELDALGNRVANLLVNVADVGSIVAIHFEKCPEAYFSILGILKAGCAFVALDPGAPKSRKEFILSDSKAPCLLTSESTAIDFDAAVEIIQIDTKSLQNCSSEKRNLGEDFTSDATCYCLYTSGTTGTPKGCEITHENSVQAMMAFQELFKGHWAEDSRWLQFAALHFDVSVLEQYWSWSVGITVVAAPRDLILDDLIASINRLEITHIDLTPSLARLTHPDDVPGLCKGVFITGGEQLKQEILDAWGPKAVIYNAYGPTEATIGVTMYQRVPINGRPSNIGKQFPNVGSYVFHKGTQIPVLKGAVGELCVSGKLVGKGYLNRPQLTDERFPTLSEFGERIYRTGDLVRILHDGCFDFLGRADDQVKLRGQRLEIGEINHVIRTGTTEVKDVATIVLHHGKGGKDALVSFLVGKDQEKPGLGFLPDENELGLKARAACRAKLPGYMVPTYFLILPYIPLSPNNKVEAKELKQLFNRLSHEQLMALVSPKKSSRKIDDDTSQRIIEILSQYTRIDSAQISIDTSIFDLGIDSITALQLSSQFKNQGFEGCSPAILLRNPIVVDLVAAMSDSSKPTSEETLVRESKQIIQATHYRHRAAVCRALDVTPKDIEYTAPCSALQQGIISKAMTDEVRGAYFNSFDMMLGEKTSLERMQHSWRDLIAAHAILRTAFVKTTDGYIQVALKDPKFHWQEYTPKDDEAVPVFVAAKRQDWVERNEEHIISPLEFVLINHHQEKRLIVHIFHAIYDGNSFDLMLQNLNAIYNGKQLLPAPSFLDAISHGPLWHHEDCRQFWETHLSGWKSSPIPQLSNSGNGSAATAVRVISGTLLEDVRKRHHVTLQPVVMALWISVLQKYVSFSPTVGVVVSGRAINLTNVENIIGPLFNTIPFFNKSLHGQTWESLIKKCHHFSTSVLPFQHVPLKSIQKWCSGGRQLFDNLFVFEVERESPGEDTKLWEITDGQLDPDYPLALEVKKLANGGIQLSLAAQRQIANDSKLEEILDEIEVAVASMVNNETLQGSDIERIALEEVADKSISSRSSGNPWTSFQWTDHALILRDEIAAFVGMEVKEITEDKTILGLGLDSIDVIQLSAKLRRKNVEMPASQIMRQQTIARMVTSMPTSHSMPPKPVPDVLFEEIKQKLRAYAEKSGLSMEDVETVLPPTPLQESMVAGMVHSDFEWYFNHDLVETSTHIDIKRLQVAWDKVIERTPILRTGFLAVDDRHLEVGYCQVVYKHRIITAEKVIMESLSEVKTLIKKARDSAVNKAASDCLFQVKFVECGEHQYMLLSIAHALYDGFSLGLIYQDLMAAYKGEFPTRSPVEPFLQKLLSVDADEADRFWGVYLDEVSPTLVQEMEALASSETDVNRYEASSKQDVSTILAFCKKASVSLQALCQACWALVLAYKTRTLDVTFGVVLSGRDFDGAEELLFPTMNTVALRCILHGTSASFLKYLESSMADIREFQAYPLRKIQAAANISGGQLFNTLFMLQKSLNTNSSEPVFKSVEGSSAVDYPVCVEAEAVGDHLLWRVACQSLYFTQQATEELVWNLDQVLSFLVTSDTTEILSFHDNNVSICGLAPVSLARDYSLEAAKREYEVDTSEWNDTASKIRQVLSYVSDIAEASILAETNLYHLGLDSISAIKVCSLLRKQGIAVNLRDLMRASSIAEMAKYAKPVKQNQEPSSPVASKNWIQRQDLNVPALLATANILEENVEAILPALPMQVYMISAWQNAEGSVFFPEFRYQIDGVDSLDSVYEAWRMLVKKTPILRTVFAATDVVEHPFLQVILKANSARENPDTQSLVKLEVSRSGNAGKFEIRLKLHHALYDGFSLPIILQTFTELLSGKIDGTADDANAWADYTTKPVLEEARQERREFWTEYLSGCAVEVTQHPLGSVRERVSYLKQTALSDVTSLRVIAQEQGISLQALFFAAYAKTLIPKNSQTTNGVNTVVFGIYLANQSANDSLTPIYPTLNLVPLKVNIADGDTLAETANNIQNDLHLITMEGRADVGLWEVAAWTGLKISSFVNFLSLPDETSDTSSLSGNIKLIPAAADVHLEPSVSDGLESTFSHRWAEQNSVRDAFPAAIDMEASIKGQCLDIGVFGSRQRISEHEALELVEQIIIQLKHVGMDDDSPVPSAEVKEEDSEDDMLAWASSWTTAKESRRSRSM